MPKSRRKQTQVSQIPRRVQPSRNGKKDTDFRLLGNPDARKAAPRNFQALTNIAVAYQTSEVTFEGAPKTLKEAQSRPDWPQFRAAILEELGQHQSMGTWVRAKLPSDRKAVGSRWVFAGIDYNETFAPVVRFDSLRTILTADLKEDIYMRQPEGFEDGTGDVLKLVKARLWVHSKPC